MRKHSQRLLPCLMLAACLPPGTSPAAALDHPELDLWHNPTFQRQFLGSYGVRSDIEPRVTASEREAMERVLGLLGEEDSLDEAAAYLAGKTAPESTAVFDFTLANIRFQQGRLEDAIASYLDAVKKYPSYRRAHKNLGLAHVRRGTIGDAVTSLTRALELGANDGLTYGLLGYAHEMNRRYVSAEGAYRQAVTLQPDAVDWRTGLARCFFRQGKYADAAAMCDELMVDVPNDADLWLLQANAYLGLGKPMKAAGNYEYLDLSGQATTRALNTLGDIYVNAGMTDLAGDAYRRALGKDDAGNAERFIRDGEVLAARGAYDEAESMGNAVRARFGDAMGDRERKRLLKLEARIAAARGTAGEEQAGLLHEIVDLDPLDGEALLLLAQHHASSGAHGKAFFLFERAAGLEGFEGEACLRHGQALVRQGRYEEALPLLRNAQDVRPREDVARYIEQVERVAQPITRATGR